MVNNFWYDGQLRKYLVQFMAIFHGLHVKNGIGACGTETFTPVPVTAGFKDRVVAAIAAGNTQNRAFSLPIMSAHIQSISIADHRRKAPDLEDVRVVMPAGGVFPDDLRTVHRIMPVAYNATFELGIYASNTMQLHQILEQILVLFNPEMQLSVSNGPLDWTRLTSVKLTDISNEENYPIGADRRIVSWTLTFEVELWLGIPMAVRDEVIRQINIRLSELPSNPDDYGYTDENGLYYPFAKPFAEIKITERAPKGKVHSAPTPHQTP